MNIANDLFDCNCERTIDGLNSRKMSLKIKQNESVQKGETE